MPHETGELFCHDYLITELTKKKKKKVTEGRISRAELLQLPVEITLGCATRVLGLKRHISPWSESLTIFKNTAHFFLLWNWG